LGFVILRLQVPQVLGVYFLTMREPTCHPKAGN
jgi:hypothetical protein